MPKMIEQFLGNQYVLVGVGVAVLLVLLALVRALSRGKKVPAQERGLQEENLADYPPPPGTPGPRRLTVEGISARVRLVVVAPVGKDQAIDVSAVEPQLDQVVKGLGAVCRQDKPRIRVWPAQLSNEGFGPTFHRLVRAPAAPGQPSRWILLAGLTPPRPRPMLLGLALWTDDDTVIGRLTLTPAQWAELLKMLG